MLLLAIDTAGPVCAVALARGGANSCDVLARASERIERGHAERLMPMIEAIMADAGIAFPDIERIAVTTGPGSFTGVRVGIAAARGLSLALSVEAVGVGSLNAIAEPHIRERVGGTVVAVLDAKRGEVYALGKEITSGVTVLEATAAPAAAIATRLAGAELPLILTGVGAPILAPHLPEAALASLSEAPDIADVAALGLREGPSAPPSPIYARDADAKAQFDKVLMRS